MKMSEQYWNAACILTGNIKPKNYWKLRDMAGVNGEQMSAWVFQKNDNRAFFFFMVAEEHRIHGD